MKIRPQAKIDNFALKNFLKQNSYKKIAEFGNKLFILENWKRLSCRESFSRKNYP